MTIGERKPSYRTATERNGTSSRRLLVLGLAPSQSRRPDFPPLPQPSPRYKIRSRAAHHPLPVSYLRSASVRPRTPTTGQSEAVSPQCSAELNRLISCSLCTYVAVCSVPRAADMGRAPCCDKASVKRGPWSPEEDEQLRSYVRRNGIGGNWIALPQKAGRSQYTPA